MKTPWNTQMSMGEELLDPALKMVMQKSQTSLRKQLLWVEHSRKMKEKTPGRGEGWYHGFRERPYLFSGTACASMAQKEP